MHDILYGYDIPTSAEFATLRREEETLANERRQLRQRLEVVEDRLHRTQAGLSPVRKLPFEILGEIFCLTVDVDGSYAYTHALLNLVLVCKAWRHVVLDAGRLWTHGRLILPTSGSSGVALWLRRAKTLPTSLQIDRRSSTLCACTSKPAYCEVRDEGLLKSLTKGPSLSRLKLTLSSPQCLRRLMLLAKSGFLGPNPWQCLQSLDLDFYLDATAPWPDSLDPTLSAFQDLPQLASLAIRFIYGTIGPVIIAPPVLTDKLPLHLPPRVLSALTTLSLTCSWMGPQVMQALQHCQNLETLDLDIFRSHQTWSTSDSELDIPALKRPGFIALLKVRNFSIAYTCTMTALRLLRWLLRCDVCRIRDPLQERVRLTTTLEALKAFSAPLRVLKVGAWAKSRPKQWTHYEDLNVVLGSLPTLTHLAIDADFEASALSKLEPTEYSSRLEHLEITKISPDGFEMQAALDWVKSMRLKKLTLHTGVPNEESEDGIKLENVLSENGTIRELRDGCGVVVERVVQSAQAKVTRIL